MKELSGEASADVAAAPERAYAMLADAEAYQSWYPEVIRRVEVLERDGDGAATLADVVISAPGVPIGDLEARLRVERRPHRAVSLLRVPYGPGDDEEFSLAWTIDADGAGCRIAVRIDAALPIPRLIPLGGLGERVAGGFARAAAKAIDGPDSALAG